MSAREPGRRWSIGDVLGWTTERFEKERLDSPRLDAEVLLAHVLGVERIRLYMDYAKPLNEQELARYRERVRRRLAREPIAYIVGEREFWSLRFAVNPAVLVPRPETELLVALAVAELERRDGAARVIDVGTGSGAIAVAVAHQMRERAQPPEVYASDCSEAALAVARDNAARHRVALTFLAGDLLEAAPAELAFDLLLSNPPYIASAELAALMPDVGRYEPRAALDGGADGLDVLRRLIAQAARRLRPGGVALLEIGWEQGAAVRELAEQHGFVSEVHRDLAGRDRVLCARSAMV